MLWKKGKDVIFLEPTEDDPVSEQPYVLFYMLYEQGHRSRQLPAIWHHAIGDAAANLARLWAQHERGATRENLRRLARTLEETLLAAARRCRIPTSEYITILAQLARFFRNNLAQKLNPPRWQPSRWDPKLLETLPTMAKKQSPWPKPRRSQSRKKRTKYYTPTSEPDSQEKKELWQNTLDMFGKDMDDNYALTRNEILQQTAREHDYQQNVQQGLARSTRRVSRLGMIYEDQPAQPERMLNIPPEHADDPTQMRRRHRSISVAERRRDTLEQQRHPISYEQRQAARAGETPFQRGLNLRERIRRRLQEKAQRDAEEESPHRRAEEHRRDRPTASEQMLGYRRRLDELDRRERELHLERQRLDDERERERERERQRQRDRDYRRGRDGRSRSRDRSPRN